MPKLSDAELRRKLQEGRNFKHLYRQLKPHFDEIKAENKRLVAKLAEAESKLQTQAIQIAELQTMVFGKKRKPPRGTFAPAVEPTTLPTKRTVASYRRPIPPATAITATEHVPLPKRCNCGRSFTALATHDRYEEDVPLPKLTPDYQAHLVTKYVVEQGTCNRCGRKVSALPLSGQTVRLGPNVRLLVCHLVASGGMSYSQVASLLLALYGLAVSDGEVASILQHQHEQWLPAYQKLTADIRAAPIRHYDETPWKIQATDNSGYAWVMSDAESPKTLFRLAGSRGAPQAKALHGRARGIRITDDYGVYRALPGKQQLCWAHLFRTIRDLTQNQEVPKDQKPYVRQWYERFAGIYQQLRQYLSEPYKKMQRTRQAAALWQKVYTLATETTPILGEPKKLSKLKAQLLRAGKQRLFTCLIADTPCDNNRAERDLRQLVLKRKRSFGSKTQKGANALATILSICTTAWRSNPEGYFRELAALG